MALSGCRKEASKDAAGAAGSGSPAAAHAVPPVDGPLVVTAVLEEIPGEFPANDIYNYAFIMKYRVEQVHKGSYADPDILVGHYNPRIPRKDIKDDQDAKVGGDVKGFQVGDRHYLVLSPLEGQWTGALEDDYYKDKRPRHWALWADKAK
jgi:hypothetical protein